MPNPPKDKHPGNEEELIEELIDDLPVNYSIPRPTHPSGFASNVPRFGRKHRPAK
jgi:hypothetical protein